MAPLVENFEEIILSQISDFHAGLMQNGLLDDYLEIMEVRNEIVDEIDVFFQQHQFAPLTHVVRLVEIDNVINHLFGPPDAEMVRPCVPREELEKTIQEAERIENVISTVNA